MTDALYSEDGIPLLYSSSRIFAVTKTEKTVEEPRTTFSVGKREFVGWGDNNMYPDDAVKIIGTTGVLSTAVGFKSRTSFGQGVVPKVVSGFDENGDPVLKGCGNMDLLRLFNGVVFRNFMAQGFRDLFKFGNCFPILYFNESGDKIVRIIIRNARHCRVSKDKRWLCVYPNFGEGGSPDKDNCEVIRMLDEDDPFFDLDTMRAKGELKGQPIAFCRIKNYYSNNDYYGIPDWDAAYRSGWVGIAQRIPKFLEHSYTNAMSLMWHIQIPESFWQSRFPKNDYKTKEERKAAIEEYMSNLEDKLCGEENVSKAFLTSYTPGMSGKDGDKWDIKRLENEIDAKERLSTSAAANSEILFSMMINPSVLGAGMPGGSYAGNAGSGSDIRESFLVSVITTYIEKQQLLDPWYLMLHYNGYGDGFVLKYKETILTTLNTGQAKEEVTT